MSTQTTVSTPTTIELSTSTQDNPTIPAWLSEALLLADSWRRSGLLERLQQKVRVTRGRMGRYEVCDFTLLLLSYASSGERALKHFFAALKPVNSVLMSAWGRSDCPVASALSRFLADVKSSAVDALRDLFEQDLFTRGIPPSSQVGLYDRQGERYLVFDVDGTSKTTRQRSLVIDDDHPRLQRRSQRACAVGHKGRKRGEVSRTRTTVAQAHTSEWLGSFAAPGNGKVVADLQQACRVIQAYLAHHQLPESTAIVRLDGLYGTPSLLSIVQEAGLGYLLRGRDYHLLTYPAVQARLAEGSQQQWSHPETHQLREVFDIGFMSDLSRGYARPFRLIVVRTPAPPKTRKVRVGKRIGEYVYELFMTSQSSASLTATDGLSLYFGRGGFEKVLADEDYEQDCDRWCSWHPPGQSFWQILSQWVWNWRLAVGWQKQAGEIRQTMWSPALPPVADIHETSPSVPVEPVLDLAPPPPTAEDCYGPMQVAQGWGRSLGKFSGTDFKIVDERTVTCPAGHAMYRRELRTNRMGDRLMLFGINPKTCHQCELRTRCHAEGSSGKAGRRVTVIRKRLHPTTPSEFPAAKPAEAIPLKQAATGLPVLWKDIPSTRLRRTLHDLLRRHQVRILPRDEQASRTSSKKVTVFTRAQRAHRRISWKERLKRNACQRNSEPWKVQLFGIPQWIADALSLNQENTFAPA